MIHGKSIEAYVSTMSDGTATVAEVKIYTPEFSFRGTGSSRRLAEDANDSELGRLLALKRALETVVTSLDAKTKRLISVNDKKRHEAANWKSLEDWKAEQAESRRAAMAAHPSGKSRRTSNGN